jgi:hypothetical protein
MILPPVKNVQSVFYVFSKAIPLEVVGCVEFLVRKALYFKNIFIYVITELVGKVTAVSTSFFRIDNLPCDLFVVVPVPILKFLIK